MSRRVALEREVAATRARSVDEVALKLHMAASGLLLTRSRRKPVDSAAQDLRPPAGTELALALP